MKRDHVLTMTICFALYAGAIQADVSRNIVDEHVKRLKNESSPSSVMQKQIDDKIQEVTDDQIKTSKPGNLFNIVKALVGGGVMLGLSQAPGIKGTGLEAGFMFGALPLAWGLGNDDAVTKVACFSAATACVGIGAIGGLLTTDVVIGENGALQRIPVESFKNFGAWLRNCKGNIANSFFEQARAAAANQQFNEAAAKAEAAALAAAQLRTTAGGLAIIGGLTSQLGGFAFDTVGRYTGKYQTAFDRIVASYIYKLKSKTKNQ